MFINKLNQLYRPRRVLYYMETSEADIDDFYNGVINEKVLKYANAFGTYDQPGVFMTSALGKPVLGIEFRAGDDRIDYPADLGSVMLDSSFFFHVETDGSMKPDREKLQAVFDEIAGYDEAHRLYSDLSVKKDPGVISVFQCGNENNVRVLYEGIIDSDRVVPVVSDDPESFDKDQLYKMAFFDPITGHYNWNHILSFIEIPMDKGISDYAFVHFDVKEFKVLNEVYGHSAANRVLCRIADAMNRADFVYTSARCHNDNFCMMIKDMPQEEMRERLGKFFDDLSDLEEDPNYTIYYRCGVVPMQRALLSGNRVADAGKTAQALGTNPGKTDIVFFSDETYRDIMWNNYIKAYIDTAIENDEFIVYLQPKIDIVTGRIRGAEALLRWDYKKRGLLPPYRFIPYFEKDGSIGKVDDIVLKKVCEALARWKREGRPLYPVSVNLSRSRLYDRNLIPHLTEIVDAYGADHALIDFELTESATYDDKAHMINVLNELREMGFGISMDDFGTGYSSLSLLTEMPLDTLKIDKSFVDKLGADDECEKDVIVLRHIITLAKELGFICLAEGAEMKCQVDKLRTLGCDIIQGFYFSRPLPVGEYETRYLYV